MKYFAGTSGLTVLNEDITTPANGMVAHVTSSWNSGYQVGDIKGAFLSDTDDTDLVGSGELVTNGTFDTDISGWTDYSAGSGSVAWNASGYIDLTGAADGRGQVYQAITTVAGSTYVAQVEVTDGTPYQVVVGTSAGGNQLYAESDNTGNRVVSFTATSTTSYIALRSRQTAETVSLDNVSIKLADEDRSVNANGLIVNGTVTRTAVATGADLVAYSGFSASNYLEQPYNADLDFGTGDFCIMGWVNIGVTDPGQKILFHRCDSSTASGLIEVRRLTGDSIRLTVGSNGYTGATTLETTNILSSGWNFIVMQRQSGVLASFINSISGGTRASSHDVSNANATTIVGTRHDGAIPFDNGSLALLRISATAPTAEQIKKIYEDEKVLFQENAQATLYGSSDAVTALAHDPVTDLLHVGTSAGRSDFQGLCRVDNTTDAVGTAISASNNLVVEE